MNAALVERVYDIRVSGYDDSLKKMNSLTQAFNRMDSAKRKLNNSLKEKIASGDAQAVKELTKQISDLEAKMKDITKTQQQYQKEAALQAKANKDNAAAELLRTKNMIAQDKELDRLIKNEEKQNETLRKQQKEINAAAGSYYDLLRIQKESIEVYRLADPKAGNFAQIKQNAIEAKRAVDSFNRSLSPDGTLVGEYKTGFINAFKQLGLSDILKSQRDELQADLNKISQKNQQLANEYRQLKSAGGDAFNKIDQELKESILLQQQMEANLNEINTSLNATGSIGGQITSALKNEFSGLKNNITQVAVSYVGFQAIVSGLSDLKNEAKDVADTMTELEVNTGVAKGGLNDFKDELKKIDTRTTVKELLNISDVALKAGVANKDLLSVTQSIDKVKVAFGKDFGSIEQGTETFAKLINIFYKDGEITGDRILSIGNSIRTLANETTASVPYLTDFAGRMAGVKQIANVSLSDIIGLGAGFEQFKQSAEVSSTALVKIIPKLAADVDKYAKIVGMSKDQFSELINNNPAEALIKVSESLVKSGQGIEEVSSALADSELGSGRITTIISTLGGKADIFRERIKNAASAMNDTSSITDAFERKNTNLAATMDKVNKKFSDVAASKTFQFALLAIASTVSFFVGILPVAITLLSLYGIGWLTLSKEIIVAGEAMTVTNGQLLLQRISLTANNILLGLQRAYTTAAAVAQSAYSLALQLYAGVAGRAAVATGLLGTAMRLLPFGIILTILGVLIASFKAFGYTVSGSSDALKKHALQLQINADIQKEALKATSQQRAEASLLVSVVKDLSISEETRNNSLKKLIELDPVFQKALINGKLNYQELDKALISYNNNLLKSAELEAAKSRSTKEFGKLTDLEAIRQEIEIAQKAKKGFGELSDEAQAAFSKIKTSVGRNAFTASLLNSSISESDFKIAKGDLNKEIQKQLQNVDAAQGVFLSKQKELDKGNTSAGSPTAKAIVQTVFERFKQLVKNGGTEEQFKLLRDDIQKQRAGYNILSKEYKDLKDLEKQLDEFLNPSKPTSYKGAKLTGEQKDLFKDIDAKRDEELAKQKSLFSQLQIDESTFLKSTLRINLEAADAKLKLLKGKNAEERKTIAELNLYKIEQQTETNKKLYEIQLEQLKNSFDANKASIQQNLDNVENDPAATNLQKLEARRKYLNELLILQTAENEKEANLEKEFGQLSAENERKRKNAILDITRDLAKNQYAITKESYEEILRLQSEAQTKQENEAKIRTADRTIKVLNDNSLGDSGKAKKIKAIELEETKFLLASEVAAAKIALEEKQKAAKTGLATEVEVSEAKKRLKLAELALLKNTTDQEKTYLQKLSSTLKDSWHNLTDFFKGVKKSNEELKQDLNEAITAAADTVKTAVNNAKDAYFEGERQKIDDQKQVALDRLNIEQQQVEDTAQSESEKETIRKQFDAKRKAEERKASEEKKQLALKQATIDFGLAVIKTLAAYPFPFSLIPVAGLTVAYMLQRAQINAQKFATGGRAKPNNPSHPVNLGPGPIITTPNIPVQSNGDNILATVKRGEVILNEDQQRKAGGASFFRSIGVPGFANGGYTGMGDLKLGDNLKAPYNPKAFILADTSGNNQFDKNMQALQKHLSEVQDEIDKTNRVIKNIKVTLVAKEVYEVNKEQDLASKVGTL